MPNVRVYRIERLEVVPGQPHAAQAFFIRPGSRRRPWKFFDGAEVPPFEGACAWFEIERKGGRWIFLRQVPPPAWA
jgi:hypothetical protein